MNRFNESIDGDWVLYFYTVSRYDAAMASLNRPTFQPTPGAGADEAPEAPDQPFADPADPSESAEATPPPSPPSPPASVCQADTTEVVKRLKPGQPGTRSLYRRYGPALVCVRYRRDSATGNTRFTTVELVVDHGPPRRQPMIRVAIRLDDFETRRQALALGAQWDPTHKTWRMPRRAAIQLGLISNGTKAGGKSPQR